MDTARKWQIAGVGALLVATVVVTGAALNRPMATPSASPQDVVVPEPTSDTYLSVYEQFADEVGGPLKLSSLGSSLTAGNGATGYDKTWGWKLSQELGQEDIDVHSFPGQALPAIRKGGVSAVLDSNPTVVFFEPGTPNNFGQDIKLSEVASLTKKTIASLRAGLPGVLIVGIVPSSITDTGENGLGATYSQYLAGDRENLLDADIVCDLSDSITDFDAELKDGIHPNDLGNDIWANAIYSCLTD